MKVFLITGGEYSEYSIYAVYSTRKKAEAHVSKRGGNIEEWEVDKEDGWTKRTHWYCRLREDGSLVNRYQSTEFSDPHDRGKSEAIKTGYPNSKHEFVGRSFESASHAHKLAAEARQEYLRGKLWRIANAS